jgi:hypothetical protein
MLLRRGDTDMQVVEELSKQGVERYYAEMVVANIHKDAADKKNFRKHVLAGLFFITAGVLMSLLSYNTGSNYFVIYTGIITLGIIIIIRGFILFRK